VRVYRPGTIGGHTATGFSNRNDFVNRLLCGIVQLGAYPRNAVADTGEAQINMCPVDFVAKAIVSISLSPLPPSAVPPKACHHCAVGSCA
jgi:thioester reductase-like protein